MIVTLAEFIHYSGTRVERSILSVELLFFTKETQVLNETLNADCDHSCHGLGYHS